MAIDPSIILSVKPAQFQMADPLETAGKSLSLQALMGQRDMQGMQMRQAQQAEADDLATRDAFRAGGDQKAIIDRLMGAGQYKPAQALQKTLLETQEKQGNINKTRAETMGKLLGFQKESAGALMANPTSENALAAVDQFERMATSFGMPELSQQAAQQRAAIQAAGNNPEALKRLAAGWALTADKFLPNYEVVQSNGQHVPVDKNSLSNPTIGGLRLPTADPAKDLILPDAQGGFRPNAPLLDAKKQVAAAGAAKTVVNMADGQKGFDNELKLRGDFRSEPVYKAHQEMQSAYSQIQQALKQGSPAGDLAGATKIMKLLDPGSVVRESELGMAMQASGLMDRLQNYATNIMSGTKLTPTQRADFNKLAGALYSESVKQYNNKRDEYTGLASNYGLNPERVTGKPSVMPTAPAVDPSKMSDADLLKALGVTK